MTQDTTRPTLGEQAASKAEELEDWEPDGDEGIMEAFAATGMGAEVGSSGSVRSAWIVLQPGSPRMEFDPLGRGGGSLTLYDNGDRHRTHVKDCPAVQYAYGLLIEHFDGMEINL